MIIDVSKPKYVHIEPGDAVELTGDYWGFHVKTTVKRVVESRGQTYVVFDNDTWRPMRTYGETWRRVAE